MQTGETHGTTFAAQLDTKQRCVKLAAQARTISKGNEVLSIVSRSLMLSLMAVSAAWVFLLKSRSAPQKVVPVQIAAKKLRQAWSANHTTA
jgi:hypothetical protein